jgi:lipoprotein-anchoring transpeptidase ErfK/SrfK
MRTLLIIVIPFIVLANEAALAQQFFTPPTSSYPSQSYRYFTPPAPAQRRARSETAVAVKIPEPETTTISEEYAKGSIVIVNHERALYFVEEPGRATRYPVAIGSPLDQWEGVQTVTAKRENPKWYPTEDIQWEMGVPPMVPPGPQNPLGPRALYLGDTLYRIHGTNRPGSMAAPSRTDAFACTMPTLCSSTTRCRSGLVFMWCLELS